MPKTMFNLFLRSVHPLLAHQHGTIFADEVLVDARKEYDQLKAEIPNIGGIRNVFQPVLTVNGWIVALHRVLRERGLDTQETIQVCHAVINGWFQLLPNFVLLACGRLMLSAPVRWFFESQARRSQERHYAEDFVWRVEHSPDGEMSLIFDECAVNKWYEAQDVLELKPYCNFVDVTYSRLMNMGVDASQTIGLGCDQCALRYKHGREIIIPQNLQGIIHIERAQN